MKASVKFRSRSKGKKKPLIPEEGEDWKVEQSEETNRAIEAARNAAFMRIAKEQLSLYCHLNSISDAECQRIADRINYEHSEKNHLRNPKPLKSMSDVIRDAPMLSLTAIEKLSLQRSKATDAEFARLQEKAKTETHDGEAGWYYLHQGEICQSGDEQTMYEKGGFWPLCPTNIGTVLSNPKVKVRRRITTPPIPKSRPPTCRRGGGSLMRMRSTNNGLTVRCGNIHPVIT